MSLDILLPILLGYTAHIAPRIKSVGVSRHHSSTLHSQRSTLIYPRSRYRNVTICALVQGLSGMKCAGSMPLVISSATAQSTGA